MMKNIRNNKKPHIFTPPRPLGSGGVKIWGFLFFLRVGFGKSETVASEKKDTVFPLEHDFFLFSINFSTIVLTVSDSRAARNNRG